MGLQPKMQAPPAPPPAPAPPPTAPERPLIRPKPRLMGGTFLTQGQGISDMPGVGLKEKKSLLGA